MLKGADDRIIEAEEGGHASPGAVLRLLAAGCVIGAILGARPLIGWAEALNADSPVAGYAVAAAQSWHSMVSRLGADRPYKVLHDQLKSLEDLRFTRN